MKIQPIQTTLVRSFAGLVIVSIALMGAATLFFLKRTLVETARENATGFAAQLARVVENYVVYMEDIALVVMNDEDVLDWMDSPETATRRDGERIGTFLASIRSVRKDIDGIFLVAGTAAREGGGRPRVIASSPGGAINPDFDFNARFPPFAKASISAAHVENIVDDRYPWVVSLAKPVGNGKGWILVNLNYAVIESLCRGIQLGKSGYVFITDASGDIVYHPRQQLVYGNLKTERIAEVLALKGGALSARVDGRDVLYSAVESERTGWTVVAVSYLDDMFAGIGQAEYSFLMLAIVCFVVSVLVSSFVATRISSPVASLRKSMQAVESGNFDIDITVNCRNEVYQLAHDCDIAVKKVRDLIEENRRDGEQKRVLELRALQAQINPHFLYNTLDSIIWMVELGENQKAIEMTSGLAKFFRLGINRGSEIVEIRTEMEYLETYLSIQKTRYSNKLDYELAFDPAIQGRRIPKLLVQPLVENAIYHGIKNKEGPGLVRISGMLEDGVIVIKVSDDGVGITPARLEEIGRSLEGHSDAGGGLQRLSGTGSPSGGAGSFGVGARNVHDRIRILFGEGYGLSYASAPGCGTTVTLRIPALEEEPR